MSEPDIYRARPGQETPAAAGDSGAEAAAPGVWPAQGGAAYSG